MVLRIPDTSLKGRKLNVRAEPGYGGKLSIRKDRGNAHIID